MDEYIYDAIDLLKRMIATPSPSREESKVADIVENFMSQAGLQPQRYGNNLVCTCHDYDASRPTLLLNSHIDTVRPVKGWTYDPFTPEEVDDRIYGLGSNDAGASVVSLLATFRMLNSEQRSYNIIFVASCEEEVSGKSGIESVLPHLPHIDIAMVGEPTGMQPAVAEKGLLVFDGTVRGVAGHAARNEGVNAIYKALPVIERLKNISFERTSPYLGDMKVSVTQIEAGTAHNVVPDVCRFVVDVRVIDSYSLEEVVEILQREAGPDCTLTPRTVRLRSSHIDESHPLIQRATMMGFTPFGSPTLSDQALMPFPSFKMGPGDSARSHTADEYITTEEIRSAIATYHTLLSGLNF